jgi:signal transduction histidine kinase
VVRQVETAPATHVADLDVLGYLVVPIRIDGETFGSLVLRQAPGTEFTSGDKHLLETLARAAGVAIANSQLYDDARRREEWLAASADVASTVLASEPAKAMGLVASGARRVVGADMAWVAVREADDVVVGAWDGRLPDAFARQIVPVAEAVLFNEVSTTGQPVVIDDASRDERVRTPEHVHGFVGPLLAVPLVASERTLGVLFIGNAQGGAPFGRLDVEMARVFAARAAMTLQFARAAADRQKLTLLADRNRIARDLHDVVIQRLFGLGLRLERIREQQHGRVAAELADINDDLDQTIDEIRNTIFSLRVSGDERASLRGQLLQVVEPFRGLLPLAPRVRIDGPIDNVVPEAVAPHLVASLSEALSNVVRHAHARQVDVVVEVDGGHLTLRVTDDGTGVPEQRVESGLANLRRRASELGGSMRLERRQDRSGTVLVWTVPLSENGAVADDEERVLTS